MQDWLRRLLNNIPLEPRQPFWQNSRAPMFIYGTGNMARDIHKVLTDSGLVIWGFLDHVKREADNLCGVPIFQPETAPVPFESRHQANVVLGVHNYQADLLAIVRRLRETGFRRIISTVELYDWFGDVLGTRYWLTRRKFYLSMTSALEQVDEMWADEASRLLYRQVLAFRLTGDSDLLPPPDLTNQYHPVDVPAWKTPLRLIDCGAFDGDTLASFIKAKIPLEAVAGFEPDLVNFQKLARFVADQRDNLGDVVLLPCGVFSSAVQQSFDTNAGMASAIDASGKTIAQCVSLDQAIPTFAPTLIKMDIEGAEYEALIGARQLIGTYKPGLAIALYHRPEHLWQIPLLIERLTQVKYWYYLRSHALNDFELVLYALPA